MRAGYYFIDGVTPAAILQAVYYALCYQQPTVRAFSAGFCPDYAGYQGYVFRAWGGCQLVVCQGEQYCQEDNYAYD
jgi:hypothetical protein